MIEDAAMVRAGHGAQFGAAIRDFQRLDLLGPVFGLSIPIVKGDCDLFRYSVDLVRAA